ncbi:glycosyltransferase [Sinorhizobium medicae]|uniref:glycosyltransferase family 2 protein n=1 Tax=Sinorhizobium medicae TaxID=110321 RepID=UPI001297A6AB|nr:glycosyltransferase family A protein [Sinorhizobium medicae]MDX0480040.1 glycosyltransferase [Sinorhizobium medicae]MDX0751360.1 glycosyltransferase [Sinorhizobium medicae]MDX0899361.1 glycosyltransferase [Sinorhizobium medicae]MDX1118129.1 glycosyltransferase [Sinorhizobium medicae]MDX1242040.1 glycosyltransferase [Sinorhizobium medicae]
MNVCDVSVVIPTYNRTTLLRRALNSIAQQTVRPAEVIVVDDCSDLAILKEVEEIASDFVRDLNLRLIVNNRNSGANFARNKGIFAASSRYIAFLDSDDLWLPEKLEMQLYEIKKAKEKSAKPALSATGRYRVDNHGEIIARQFGGHFLDVHRIRKSNFIGTLSSVVVDASVARDIRGFDESLPASQDWDFFIRLCPHVQFVGIEKPLCVYVDHDRDRITLDHRKKLRGHLAVYRKHCRHLESDAIKAAFLRHLAEDYQELGKSNKASALFAASIALAAPLKPELRQATQWILRCILRVFPPARLKTQRYRRYRRTMNRLLKDQEARAEIIAHRETIRILMI